MNNGIASRKITKLDAYLALPQYMLYRVRSKPTDHIHVFVYGAPRSGTTLMQVILARHSQFLSIEAETGMFTPSFVLNRSRYWEGERKILIDKCNSTNLVSLCDEFSLALKTHRKEPESTFVEKTPNHVFQAKLLLKMFPNSYFINMIRDPRDCYASSLRHPKFEKNPVKFSKYWKKSISKRVKLGPRSNILDIWYRDLTSMPETSVSNVMKFLGSNLESQQIQPGQKSFDSRHKRIEFSKLNKPITSASVGSYKKELDNKTIKLIEKYSGNYLSIINDRTAYSL